MHTDVPSFDKRLVVYETLHSLDSEFIPTTVVNNAHDAAITCMTCGKDADNTWYSPNQNHKGAN